MLSVSENFIILNKLIGNCAIDFITFKSSLFYYDSEIFEIQKRLKFQTCINESEILWNSKKVDKTII